jgi:hypothetical protein
MSEIQVLQGSAGCARFTGFQFTNGEVSGFDSPIDFGHVVVDGIAERANEDASSQEFYTSEVDGGVTLQAEKKTQTINVNNGTTATADGTTDTFALTVMVNADTIVQIRDQMLGKSFLVSVPFIDAKGSVKYIENIAGEISGNLSSSDIGDFVGIPLTIQAKTYTLASGVEAATFNSATRGSAITSPNSEIGAISMQNLTSTDLDKLIAGKAAGQKQD